MTVLDQKLSQARARLQFHDYAGAVALYEKLARQAPRSSSIWAEYGAASAGARNFALADMAWRKALDLDPQNADLASRIGHFYENLRHPPLAEQFYAQAAAADPRHINSRMSLAVLLERTHRLDEARARVAECLAINPRDDQARYFSAVLDRRENRFDEAERHLRDLIASEPQYPYVRHSARYELAQLLDRSNQADEAMEMLREAKNCVRQLTNTDALLAQYQNRAAASLREATSLPKDSPRAWDRALQKREAIPALAFLGGHPRSGTTLLEQVLDANPSIAALDEPTAFTDIIAPEFEKSSAPSIPRINVLRREYAKTILTEAGCPQDRLLLDKNPSPTSLLPVWLRVFPELRVIIALRDPRDVVLSCYFQNFPLNAASVNFLSLEGAARHYANLMDVWLAAREWQGFAWVETRYEDMVANLEREGRRVTEFLGLHWNDSQARFHESSRGKHLHSPTYQDVTRPVYNRSVARWRAYAKHLAPILPLLEPYCRKLGYS